MPARAIGAVGGRVARSVITLVAGCLSQVHLHTGGGGLPVLGMRLMWKDMKEKPLAEPKADSARRRCPAGVVLVKEKELCLTTRARYHRHSPAPWPTAGTRAAHRPANCLACHHR